MNKVNSKGLCHSPTPFCHRLLVSIDYVLNTTLYNNSLKSCILFILILVSSIFASVKWMLLHNTYVHMYVSMLVRIYKFCSNTPTGSTNPVGRLSAPGVSEIKYTRPGGP